MGRPYRNELENLERTFSWAVEQSLDPLSGSIALASSHPLLTVGSGGSLSVAHFAATLHQGATGKLAKAVTPLDLVGSAAPNLRDLGVLLISAGGRNPDILGAFKRIVRQEPKNLMVMCSRRRSPLSQLAAAHEYVNSFDFDLPTRKDGFLATNSLFAFCILLYRLYQTEREERLLDFSSFAARAKDLASLGPRSAQLWKRSHTVLLHGTSTHSAALDIESKFTEAAIGAISVTDFRNFAHGRHHWLTGFRASSGVLAITTDEDRELAGRTLRLIPRDIPAIEMDLAARGPLAGLLGLYGGLHVVGAAAAARGIDPGRPKVSLFGRKLYHLQTFGKTSRKTLDVGTLEGSAIERKSRASLARLDADGQLDSWRRSFSQFIGRLSGTVFDSMVLDYDGTLCSAAERFVGIRNATANAIVKRLQAGTPVGIATGRGQSVPKDLRDKIPKTLWSKLIVGYYNGAIVRSLEEPPPEHNPNGLPCSESLMPVREALESNTQVKAMATLSYRAKQITIQAQIPALRQKLIEILSRVIAGLSSQVTLVTSTHSIDLLAPGVSKCAVVTELHRLFNVRNTLCIGDQGEWPGNDFELLSSPNSLSVEDVSSDPATCWNLAAPGQRGVQATLGYFEWVQQAGASRFKLLPLDGDK